MMSRCTSFTPPPKVSVVALRYACSSMPPKSVPGSPSRHEARGADDLEQQPVALDEELGAHDLHGRRLGHVRDAGRDRPRRAPVEQLQRLELGVDARQVELHPGLVEHRGRRRAPSVFAAQLHTSSSSAVGDAGRRERDALVVQLRGDQRQPSFSGPTRFATGTRTSCVVGGVGALAAERVDRRHRESGRVGRHQDDRDALVLRRVRDRCARRARCSRRPARGS